MNNKEQTFEGFYPETLKFLSDLRENNNKEWFEKHKQGYQKYLQEPLQNLAMDLSEYMLAIDPLLVVGPKAVSRIYRDARFSDNKSHYKTTMWLTLRRPRQDWMDAPAYFFEIVPTDGRNRKKQDAKASAKRGPRAAEIVPRSFYGATYLLDAIGEQLGITHDLKQCFSDTYKQILSIAYYLILEDSTPLYRFEKWGILHKHPYGKNITSQRSSELFASITE